MTHSCTWSGCSNIPSDEGRRARRNDGRPDDLAESRLKGVEQTLIAARSRHQITGVFVVADRELLILPVRLLELATHLRYRSLWTSSRSRVLTTCESQTVLMSWPIARVISRYCSSRVTSSPQFVQVEELARRRDQRVSCRRPIRRALLEGVTLDLVEHVRRRDRPASRRLPALPRQRILNF